MQQIRLGLCFALFFCTASLADDVKIGFIDLERSMNEVKEGVEAKADLKKVFEAKQAILDTKQNEIKKLQEAFESQAAVMKPNVRQEKGMELQKKAADVQQLYMTMQQEMAKRQQDVMDQILQKMAVVANNMRSEGGYTAILNKNLTVVLAMQSHLDLTNEAIRRYNDMYSNKAKASPKKK